MYSVIASSVEQKVCCYYANFPIKCYYPENIMLRSTLNVKIVTFCGHLFMLNICFKTKFY